jgi:F-type H+-transporting ATPase subunit gamma
MSNLKQFRNRIKSIKSSEKITKAMQMVSASKLQKLKQQISNSDPYLKVLSEILVDYIASGLLADLPINNQRYFKADESKADLFIIITSERGLCGSFNSSLVKKVKIDIAKMGSDGRGVKLLIIGKKGYDLLKGKYKNIIDGYYNIIKGERTGSLLAKIKLRVLALIDDGQIGRCYIYYNKFKNAITQETTKQCLLPAEVNNSLSVPDKLNANKFSSEIADSRKEKQLSNFEFEGEDIIHNVIELYINGVVNYTLLQSRASEEGARMTAMDNATNNAQDMISKLTLKLNRSRQATITKELIEIISGAEVA